VSFGISGGKTPGDGGVFAILLDSLIELALVPQHVPDPLVNNSRTGATTTAV